MEESTNSSDEVVLSFASTAEKAIYEHIRDLYQFDSITDGQAAAMTRLIDLADLMAEEYQAIEALDAETQAEVLAKIRDSFTDGETELMRKAHESFYDAQSVENWVEKFRESLNTFYLPTEELDSSFSFGSSNNNYSNSDNNNNSGNDRKKPQLTQTQQIEKNFGTVYEYCCNDIIDWENTNHSLVAQLLFALSKSVTEPCDNLDEKVVALGEVISDPNDKFGSAIIGILSYFPDFAKPKIIPPGEDNDLDQSSNVEAMKKLSPRFATPDDSRESDEDTFDNLEDADLDFLNSGKNR